jgi:hypothetical protein
MKPRKLSTIPKKDKDIPSVTDKINMDDELIKQRLDKYVETPIDKINVSSHVRYFIFDKNQKKYMLRLGGILTKKEKDFVILSNGELTWSVSLQIVFEDVPYPTKFWRILTNEQYQEKKHGEKAKQLESQNEELRRMLEDFKKEMDSKRLLETPPVIKKPPMPLIAEAMSGLGGKEILETSLNTMETIKVLEEPQKDLKETQKKPQKPRTKKPPMPLIVETMSGLGGKETIETPAETPTITVVKQRKPRVKKCSIETTD